MAWAEDVTLEYFGTDDFADTWTVDGVSVRAIFDDSYVEGLGIEGTAPTIQVPSGTGAGFILSDAGVETAVAAGDVAIGPQGTFTVRGEQPSGDGALGKGVTTLVLEA